MALTDILKKKKIFDLLIASSKGNIQKLNHLIKSGVDINGTISHGVTALLIAVGNNDLETALLLLKNGANVNAATTSRFKKNRDTIYSGTTVLMVAAFKGAEEIIKKLIALGANPKLTNEMGSNALMMAANNGNSKIIEMFLKQSTDININAQTQKTFHYKDFIVHKGNTALLTATSMGNMKSLKVLLAYGANPNTESDVGLSPLMVAALKGDSKMVSLLIEKGANVNAKALKSFKILENSDPIAKGGTVLMGAVYCGHFDIVQMLLSNHAHVNVQEEAIGNTPLHMAILLNHMKIAKLLLKHGAQFKIKNKTQETSYELAQKLGNHNIFHEQPVL